MADGPPLLARLLGADRYLRFQYLLHEYPGVTVLLAGLPVALLGGALLLLIPDRQTLTLTPDGYLRVAVVFSEPIPSDDAEMSVRFHVELPDGARVAVRTDDMARAMNVVDSACIERLIDDSGHARYRLAWPEDCD